MQALKMPAITMDITMEKVKHTLYIFSPRVLDVAPESEEDEDTIIERQRQLRKAIVNKYHQSVPTTPQGASPAPPSEANSDVIEERIGEELQEEERLLEKAEEGDRDEGIVKNDPKEEVNAQEELKKKKTSLSALREAIRNGDMFSEGDLFQEMQLVSVWLQW